MDIEPITRQLSQGSSVDQRREAAMLLTRIEDPVVIPPLIESLKDHEDIVIFSTLALVNIGTPAVPHLIKAIRSSKDPQLKIACAEILGEINDPESLSVLIELLHSQNDISLKQSIVDALGMFKNDLANAELHRLLTDKEPVIVTFAALALHRNGEDHDLFKNLVDLLADAGPEDRGILSWGLVEICGRPKIPYLKKIADSSSREDVKKLLDDIIHGISIKFQN